MRKMPVNQERMPLEISPAQCRAARAMLRWTLRGLADRAGVERQKIHWFESERRAAAEAARGALRAAFEAGGVEFGEDGWIRLRAE
jgi:transcriptional regulator with XRE-family HTH domain